MPERKTLNEDLLYKGSSASLPRLHVWDFKEFAVTQVAVVSILLVWMHHIDADKTHREKTR